MGLALEITLSEEVSLKVVDTAIIVPLYNDDVEYKRFIGVELQHLYKTFSNHQLNFCEDTLS